MSGDAMNLKSFAAVLSHRQGGVHLKPGQSCQIELSEEEVKNIFGEDIVAHTTDSLSINIRYLPANLAIVDIRRKR
jgi:hypothetical protein